MRPNIWLNLLDDVLQVQLLSRTREPFLGRLAVSPGAPASDHPSTWRAQRMRQVSKFER